MMDTFRKCYQEGGIRIFGRGLVAMSLRAFPLNGATFLGYLILQILKENNVFSIVSYNTVKLQGCLHGLMVS